MLVNDCKEFLDKRMFEDNIENEREEKEYGAYDYLHYNKNYVMKLLMCYTDKCIK